jgi:hypothetical protein
MPNPTLHEAAQHGDIERVKAILEKGTNVRRLSFFFKIIKFFSSNLFYFSTKNIYISF